jgi:hypothetical protein
MNIIWRPYRNLGRDTCVFNLAKDICLEMVAPELALAAAAAAEGVG